MRVLNAYAGIGGNRHLWPSHWQVTAVEFDERVAAEYARRYPADVVLVQDAHAFVLDHAHQFDAVWTSPPCPTHSRLARTNNQLRESGPDPRLFAEVEFLRSAGGSFVVENVHTYYTPPILPDVVTARHYYWASDVPVLLTPLPWADLVELNADQLADAYGLPRVPFRALKCGRKAIRNAVHPVEGLELAVAAFSSELQAVA